MILGKLMLFVGAIFFLMAAGCLLLMTGNLSSVDKSKSKFGIFLNKGGWALLSENHLTERGLRYKFLAVKFLIYGFYMGLAGLIINIISLVFIGK